VPTNQQRREAERRRLQRQLEERRAREATRKRMTLIGSVVGTVLIIGAVLGVVLATTGGSGNKEKDTVGSGGRSSSSPAATSAASTPAAAPLPTAPCAAPPKGSTATFEGVTVSGATDLKHAPKVKSVGKTAPTTLHCEDLVVGKGKPATPTSKVSVQYLGALYTDGKEFDSSWSRGGKPISFPLTQVVHGFTEGIGGAGKVAPMRVGGRRVMILPASLGYGANGAGSTIPPNAALIFVVDLTGVS
jgi:peptidylprolyl isomerase